MGGCLRPGTTTRAGDSGGVGDSRRGSRSKDGGRTWSATEMVASDVRNEEVHYVPAQLLSHRGVLHAFVGKMTGHDLIVDCAVYTRDDRRGTMG